MEMNKKELKWGRSGCLFFGKATDARIEGPQDSGFIVGVHKFFMIKVDSLRE